jgi:vitamin K-dependent gamma-carboxylase
MFIIGLTMENFIASGLGNVTLTVLKGDVEFIQNSKGSDTRILREVSLSTGESTAVTGEAFHHIKTVSSHPSCYMYSFVNVTAQRNK